MEHRLSARQAIGLVATLHSIRFGSTNVTIRNVSHGGLFLETDAKLPTHSFVEIEYKEPPEGVTHTHCKGVVVHSKNNGVGLMVSCATTESR